MKRAFALLAVLSVACASAEVRTGESDPASPTATVAALDVGMGVLSPSFSAERLAPDAPAADPHEGHHMHDHSEHASPASTPSTETSSTASASPSAARPATKRPQAPAAVTYTCMHHPEVVSTAKGQCPKCGMDLVPKTEGAKAHGSHP